MNFVLIYIFFTLAAASFDSACSFFGLTLPNLLPSSADHHDGEQHDVQVHLRVLGTGEDWQRRVWRRLQVCEAPGRLHLRHQEVQEAAGRISGRVS